MVSVYFRTQYPFISGIGVARVVLAGVLVQKSEIEAKGGPPKSYNSQQLPSK